MRYIADHLWMASSFVSFLRCLFYIPAPKKFSALTIALNSLRECSAGIKFSAESHRLSSLVYIVIAKLYAD